MTTFPPDITIRPATGRDAGFPRRSGPDPRRDGPADVPMANAFARAGYVVFERAINMIWK